MIFDGSHAFCDIKGNSFIIMIRVLFSSFVSGRFTLLFFIHLFILEIKLVQSRDTLNLNLYIEL